MTLIAQPDYAPREVFSVSQVEKAFGSAHEPERGCLRSWAYRYLAGLKEPEYTYEEACQLPENTPELAKLKGGIKKKTYGKVFHSIAEAYYRGEAIDLSQDAANRFFSGSHLAPHPSQCAEIEIEKPIKIRTGPVDDSIAWNGFKDLVVRTWDVRPPDPRLGGLVLAATYEPSPRYLFDWKTTTPTVDNRRNRDLGKPHGSWTWQKDAKAIKIDFQANLYAYDEYVNYGALPRGRWIYFANSGKPDARATDYEPEFELVFQAVTKLDGYARTLRDYIRAYRDAGKPGIPFASDVTPNLSNCAAFGGCPYRSSVGGPCTAEQSGVIPVGSLSRTITRPSVKPRDAEPLGPGFAFVTQEHQTPEGTHNMGLAEDIANAKAQRAGQAGQSGATPPGFNPPPGGPGPHVPGYTQNTGAPIPTAGLPPVFAAPTAAPAGFDPSFAFGGSAAPAGPPVAPPAPPPVKSGYPPYGTATQNPDYICDGEGGYLAKNQIQASAAAGEPNAQRYLAAQNPPAQTPVQTTITPPGAGAPAETFPSHVNPPEAANPNLPTEPARRGRPKKAAPTVVHDTTPAPPPVDAADFAAPELSITLALGKMIVTVPAPAEMFDTLQAYVLKAVAG